MPIILRTILAGASGLHLGHVLLFYLTGPIVQYAELRKQGFAMRPLNDTSATNSAVPLADRPPVCISTALHPLQWCQSPVFDGCSFQSRSETLDIQEVHNQSVSTPQSSRTCPISSSSVLHNQLPMGTSEHVEVNVMPTITIHTTRTKTVTNYVYAATKRFSDASTIESSKYAPRPTRATCNPNERPSSPMPSTCGFEEHLALLFISTCGLGEVYSIAGSSPR